MIDKSLVNFQCFLLFILAYILTITPTLNGIADYRYSKSNKGATYLIALIISLALFSVTFLLISIADKDNTLLWYAITLIAFAFSGYILLLDIDNYAKPIKHPSKLKEYICNARYEILKGKSLKVLRIGKGLIYGYYIAIMILNQIGDLYDNCLSNSLYLKINEYSLIILFAIVQMKNEVGKKS